VWPSYPRHIICRRPFPQFPRGSAMLKFFASAVGIIFLIGLLVVIGLLMLIF
jgi:hypothetical protein